MRKGNFESKVDILEKWTFEKMNIVAKMDNLKKWIFCKRGYFWNGHKWLFSWQKFEHFLRNGDFLSKVDILKFFPGKWIFLNFFCKVDIFE